MELPWSPTHTIRPRALGIDNQLYVLLRDDNVRL